MWSIAGLRPATPSHKHGQYWLSYPFVSFFLMKMVSDEIGFWWKWFLMKVVFDESGFWWNWFLMKLVFDESGFLMKVVFWWNWFLMRVVFDESGFWWMWILMKNFFWWKWFWWTCTLPVPAWNHEFLIQTPPPRTSHIPGAHPQKFASDSSCVQRILFLERAIALSLSWAHTAHSVAQVKVCVRVIHSHPTRAFSLCVLMSLLNRSLLSSSCASPSRSTTTVPACMHRKPVDNHKRIRQSWEGVWSSDRFCTKHRLWAQPHRLLQLPGSGAQSDRHSRQQPRLPVLRWRHHDFQQRKRYAESRSIKQQP